VAASSTLLTFLWTKALSSLPVNLPGLLLVLSDNRQVFEPAGGESFYVCKHFGGHGILSNGSLMSVATVKITGTYSECTEQPAGHEVDVTPAEYELTAQGSLGITKSIVFTVPAFNCSIKVAGGGTNSQLLTVLFLNQANGILLAHLEILGFHARPSGGLCGAANSETTRGTYFGLLLVSVDGETIKWD
jgi:hypothetical protein